MTHCTCTPTPSLMRKKRRNQPWETAVRGFSQEPRPVYYGLYNQGATCYLNSVLQLLFMTGEVEGRFDSSIQADLQLKTTFEELKNRVCHTTNINPVLGIENVYEQSDAAECLEKILHVVSPAVSEIFRGQMIHKSQCCRGHDVIEEKVSFFTLPLSTCTAHGQPCSVKQAFEMLFQPVLCSEENKVYCGACESRTEATTKFLMEKYPQVLILLLKRFDIHHGKLDHSVAVPIDLQREGVRYKLHGMVDHSGSLDRGHYTATIQSNENKIWYKFDDSWIYEAERQPFVQEGTYMSRSAYLLMYRKVPGSKVLLSSDAHPEWALPGAKAEGGETQSSTVDQVKGDNVERGRNTEGKDDKWIEKKGWFSTRWLRCRWRSYGRLTMALSCVALILLWRMKWELNYRRT